MQNPSIPKPDRVRLQHMLDAAHDALTFTQNRSRNDLDTDRMLTLALVKCIEIIGEAAGQVSRETRITVPDIPWANIVGMRNRLIHVYHDVNHDIVWQTIQQDLPGLIPKLETILQADPKPKEE